MAISAQDVKKLRDMTNAGMMDCKEALTETAGDFESAVEWLRKKGLSKAAKKAGRETKEGLVAALVSKDETVGSLVQVNCETDFVARNETFQGFVGDVAGHVQATGIGSAGAFLEGAFQGKTGQEALNELIAKVGENMSVSRVSHFKAPANGKVHAYIHPGARVGVLIEAAVDKAEVLGSDGFRTLLHDLAMQVAAAQARFVRREDVDPPAIEKEREIYRDQLKESGKPAQVIEKIIDGKLASFFSEVCLLEQPFIKDQDRKVQDLVAATGKQIGANITVTRFSRFALGEAL
jgi:elongation factor Ts